MENDSRKSAIPAYREISERKKVIREGRGDEMNGCSQDVAKDIAGLQGNKY